MTLKLSQLHDKQYHGRFYSVPLPFSSTPIIPILTYWDRSTRYFKVLGIDHTTNSYLCVERNYKLQVIKVNVRESEHTHTTYNDDKDTFEVFPVYYAHPMTKLHQETQTDSIGSVPIPGPHDQDPIPIHDLPHLFGESILSSYIKWSDNKFKHKLFSLPKGWIPIPAMPLQPKDFTYTGGQRTAFGLFIGDNPSILYSQDNNIYTIDFKDGTKPIQINPFMTQEIFATYSNESTPKPPDNKPDPKPPTDDQSTVVFHQSHANFDPTRPRSKLYPIFPDVKMFTSADVTPNYFIVELQIINHEITNPSAGSCRFIYNAEANKNFFLHHTGPLAGTLIQLIIVQDHDHSNVNLLIQVPGSEAEHANHQTRRKISPFFPQAVEYIKYITQDELVIQKPLFRSFGFLH